jgi:hypothetical protein
VNYWAVSWPFAQLSIDGGDIRLRVMGREYLVPSDRIERLVRTRQLSPTVGIRISHSDKALPGTLIFFPFRFRRVASALRDAGFEVDEK